MKHKTIAIVAVIMIIVFGATILMYPTLFGPNVQEGQAPIEAPPAVPAVPAGP